MFKKILACVFSTAVILGVSSTMSVAHAGDVPAPTKPKNPCVLTNPAQWNNRMAMLSTPTRNAWMSSDGFSSVKLPRSNHVAFFNGDTLYGKKVNDRFVSGMFVRNSAVIYKPWSQNFSDCFVSQPIPTANGLLYDAGTNSSYDYYWPGVGLSSNFYDTETFVISAKMHSSSTISLWNFQQVGSTIFSLKYSPASSTPLKVVRKTPFNVISYPRTDQPVVWSSVVDDGVWTYVYATHWRSEIPWSSRDLYVARVPSKWAHTKLWDVRGWQFYTVGGWKYYTGKPWSLKQMKKVGENVFGAGGSISMNPKGGFYAVTRPLEFIDNKIVVYTSKTATGPFTVAKEYPLLQPPKVWYYLAKAHPNLPAPAGKVWISTDTNRENGDFRDPISWYYEKWMLIDIPAPAQ